MAFTRAKHKLIMLGSSVDLLKIENMNRYMKLVQETSDVRMRYILSLLMIIRFIRSLRSIFVNLAFKTKIVRNTDNSYKL